MSDVRENGSSKGPLTALILGGAIVAASAFLGNSLVESFRIKHGDRTIVVTGSSKRRITSDRIVWKSTVESRAPELAAAYKGLAADMPKLIGFLKTQGVEEKDVVASAIYIKEIHPRDKEGNVLEETILSHSVWQEVTVTSDDVKKISQVSREVTRLIEEGLHIQSEPPMFLYTKLADLKIEMLADASNDARVRAEAMASKTNAKVVRLQTARMGVTQVNAANESVISPTGTNDTSELEKDVLAIVTATFGIQ